MIPLKRHPKKLRPWNNSSMKSEIISNILYTESVPHDALINKTISPILNMMIVMIRTITKQVRIIPLIVNFIIFILLPFLCSVNWSIERFLYFIAWFIHRHVKIYRVVYLLPKLFFRFFRFCIFSLSHVTSPHFRRIGSKE